MISYYPQLQVWTSDKGLPTPFWLLSLHFSIESRGQAMLHFAVLTHTPFCSLWPFFPAWNPTLSLASNLHHVCLFLEIQEPLYFLCFFPTLRLALLSFPLEWLWAVVNKFRPLTASYTHMIQASHCPPNISDLSPIPPSSSFLTHLFSLLLPFVFCLVCHRV